MSKINRPLQIVMTPVRNEAWVLRAFLTATSQWADYIIIADQMSTDGSREIYADFQVKGERLMVKGGRRDGEKACELIVIDNKNPEFNEAERQAMLVAKAREVAAGRDTLLWGLDADEILDARYKDTADWQKILNSKPGDVFCFRWAIVSDNLQEFQISTNRYPWLFHDDGQTPHAVNVRKIHSMRIPYPADEHSITEITDFYVFHLAWVNAFRVNAKRRFYTFLDRDIRHISPITMARVYTNTPEQTPMYPISDSMIYTTDKNSFNLWNMVDTQQVHCWMDDYVVDRLARFPKKDIAKLMIWDSDFIREYNLQDPRTIWMKIVHWYLMKTMPQKQTIIIRMCDKILKYLM